MIVQLCCELSKIEIASAIFYWGVAACIVNGELNFMTSFLQLTFNTQSEKHFATNII
jgi:hypothetical protein